jgi:hypothetical protein
MTKRSKIIFVAALLATSIILVVGTTKKAHSEYVPGSLFNPIEGMTEMMDTMFTTPMGQFLDAMLEAYKVSIDAMLRLSDDIGDMSDRIGTMADRILTMADNIGIMADRIVKTEELMASTLLELTGNNGSVVTTGGPVTMINVPVENDSVSLSAPIAITLSGGYPDYILYMSNNSDLSGATNVLVKANDTTAAWNRAADYATGSQLFLAVKAVEGSSIGTISNTVKVNLIP